jgi:hypothetical protein
MASPERLAFAGRTYFPLKICACITMLVSGVRSSWDNFVRQFSTFLDRRFWLFCPSIMTNRLSKIDRAARCFDAGIFVVGASYSFAEVCEIRAMAASAFREETTASFSARESRFSASSSRSASPWVTHRRFASS